MAVGLGSTAQFAATANRALQRSLEKVARDASREVLNEIRDAAVPVKATAERLAFGEITNIGPVWGRMRVGVSTGAVFGMREGSVFLAPATRNRGGSRRPQFGTLLVTEAMQPAVEQHEDEIRDAVEDSLARLFRAAGFIY